LFLHNLLLDENHPLHNRNLHISGAFVEMEKVDIETEKTDIETEKVDIETVFQKKTINYISKMQEAFSNQKIFGRSDVMEVIGIKASRASELLKELAEHGIIESVTGYGKGKYRFKQW
jgi:ribosomal protein S25